MFKRERLPVLTLALHFLRDDAGATAIEYAMIASGIGVAVAAAIVTLGSSVQGLYQSVATTLK
jgi:pilus assembly protein Flp/PilA